MPLFDYECDCGMHFERVLPIAMCDEKQPCPECGETAKKVIELGHGGIFRTGDDLQWVKDAAKVLGDGETPNPNINNIQDLRRYYAENPNVIPAESHPALPSSLGDAIKSRPKATDLKKERHRKGQELIRRMRRIEFTGQATA